MLYYQLALPLRNCWYAREKVHFPRLLDVNCQLPAADLNVSLGDHAQDRAADPIVASDPYYYSRPEPAVSTMGPFFPGCLKCRGAVPAQAACLLPGTPNFTSQARPRRALFVSVVVSILQLERGVDDRQTGDSNLLASQGI